MLLCVQVAVRFFVDRSVIIQHCVLLKLRWRYWPVTRSLIIYCHKSQANLGYVKLGLRGELAETKQKI